MRGQLTEQLPEDGTAEKLFLQIQTKKHSLIKDGIIKKEKPLLEVSEDEIPYELPNNWIWVRMGDYCQKITDQVASGSFASLRENVHSLKSPSYAIMVKTADFANGFSKNLTYTDKHGYDFLNNSNLFGGELILSNVGSVGKCFIVPELPYKMTLAPNAVMVRLVEESGKDYLYFFLTSSQGFNELDAISTGVAVKKFNKTELKKILIPIPPLAEQNRIVEKIKQLFSILDTLDELQTQYADNLTALKSKLIDAAIQGKLTEHLPEDGTAEELYQQIQIEKAEIVFERKGRKDNSILPFDEKEPFEIPEKWKWIRFGETGFFRKGPFGSSLTKSMFVPKSADTIKVYEQQHAIKKDHTLGTYYITKEYFDTSMKGFEVLSGDIIVSCAGTIGETYILPNNIERGIINQALMRITVVPSIDKQFFLYYFDSQLKKSAQDGNGSAITNIPPFDVLKNLYFPLPPLAEQKRIVQKLNEILPICERKNK